MYKKIIFSLTMFLFFSYSGITYAAENPFKGLTQDQIIQKYFAGRQLDQLEGIWTNWSTIIIIKTSAMDTIKDLKDIKDPKDYAYILVEYSFDPQNAEIFGVRKHKIPHFFPYDHYGRPSGVLRQISPIALVWAEHSVHSAESLFITRIYPDDSK